MNELPTEIEVKGLTAYEQARAFENLQRRGMAWIYLVGVLLFVLVCGIAAATVPRPVAKMLAVANAVVVVFVVWAHWRRLRERYAKNLVILAELKREYGENLPWLKMERHFADLAELQRELKEERERAT
jgi:hypothetical protein